MKKSSIQYRALQFGIEKEQDLIRCGKDHEAYQIRHARETLVRASYERSKYSFYNLLDEMTTNRIDPETGYHHYHPIWYVADDTARSLVAEFKKIIKEDEKNA